MHIVFKKNAIYGPTILRFSVGIMFIIAGISKLFNFGVTMEFMKSMNIPIPEAFAWLLLLAEIVFGVAVLLGFKLKFTVWPLVMILLSAIFTVHIPAANQGMPLAGIILFLHFITLAALISIFLTGPGAWAMEQK